MDSSKKTTKHSIIQNIIHRKQQIFHWMEVRPIQSLIVIYFIFASFKICITQIFLDPSNLVDGFIYMKMAGSFFQDGSFHIYNEPTHQYPPLYPIMISPAYLFHDSLMIFRTIKLLSVFYSTLIIFPVFFITRELTDTKKSLLLAILISSLSAVIIWNFNVVSECVFYTLFLTSIYFIYKSTFEKGYTYTMLTGVFLGLCFLTRYTAVVFVPAVFIFYIVMYFYRKNKSITQSILLSFKKCILVSVPMALIILPWMIRNGLLFGFTYRGVLGYSKEISSATTKLISIVGEMTFSAQHSTTNNINYLENFIIHFLLDNGIIILSCGILFVVLFIWMFHHSFMYKTTNVFALSVLAILLTEFLIVVDSIHNIKLPWRLHGRYLEPIFPLLIILGSIGLIKIKNLHQKFIYLVLIICLPFTLLLANTWGYMGGMISVSYIGILQDFRLYLDKFLGVSIQLPVHIHYKILILIVIISLFVLFFILIKYRVSKKKITTLSCLLLMLSTAISAGGYMVRDAHTSNSELYDFGVWLNKEFSGKNEYIYFDEDLGTAINQLSIWINAPTIVGSWNETNNDVHAAYLISNNPYSYPVIYKQNLSSSLAGTIRGRNGWSTIIYVYSIEE
jgi:4-amino-4-deoxy-L-arabinose transferase-like glycosyltransferase